MNASSPQKPVLRTLLVEHLDNSSEYQTMAPDSLPNLAMSYSIEDSTPAVFILKAICMLSLCFSPPSWARVCDTLEEVEGRYGKPITSDHPMMDNVDIASLANWPKDKGYIAHALMVAAFSRALAAQGDGVKLVDALGKLDWLPVGIAEKVWTAESLAKQLENYVKFKTGVKLYVNKGLLVQVAYFGGTDSKYYSISEAFYKLNEEKVTSSNKQDIAEHIEFSIEPIDDETLKTIYLLNLERMTVPVGLNQIVAKADTAWKAIGKKNGVNYTTDLAINRSFGPGRLNRIWLNFTGKPPPRTLLPGDEGTMQLEVITDHLREGWKYDPFLGEGQMGYGYKFYTYAEYNDILRKGITEATQKSKQLDGIKSGF
jgi:hypothetical protein